jgi:hypothetical protein
MSLPMPRGRDAGLLVAVLATGTAAVLAATRGPGGGPSAIPAAASHAALATAATDSWRSVLAGIDASLPAAGECPHAARCFEADGAAAFAWVRALEAARWPAPALLRIEASRAESPLGSAGTVWVELAAPIEASPARAAGRSEA